MLNELIQPYVLGVGQGIVLVLASVMAIHALIFSYHWFAYGTKQTMNLVGLFGYLGGAFIILSAMYSVTLYF